MAPSLFFISAVPCSHSCKFAAGGQVGTGPAADPESAAPAQGRPGLAAGQAAGQAGKEARAQTSRRGPPPAGQSMQSLKSLLSMLLLSNPGEEVLGSLQGRSALELRSAVLLRKPLLLVHDNTAPFQSMTAAEMLQAQAEILSDARERLQEIRDEIALLEAEMADLEEVIDG